MSQIKDLHLRTGKDEAARESISTKSKPSSKKLGSHELWESEVAHCANRYMATFCPWEPSKYSGDIELAKVTNPFGATRYTNSHLEDQYTFAELYSVLPKTAEHINMFTAPFPPYIKAMGLRRSV